MSNSLRRLIKVMVIFVCCIIAMYTILWWCFRDMSHLPKGELIAQYPSLTGESQVNIFLVSMNATGEYSIRGEIEHAGRKRNIYWQYDETSAAVHWIDSKNVMINSHKINIATGSYDWRRHISDS